MIKVKQCPVCFSIMKPKDDDPKMLECSNCQCQLINLPDYHLIPGPYLLGHS